MKYVIVAKVLIDQKSKTFHYKKKKNYLEYLKEIIPDRQNIPLEDLIHII